MNDYTVHTLSLRRGCYSSKKRFVLLRSFTSLERGILHGVAQKSCRKSVLKRLEIRHYFCATLYTVVKRLGTFGKFLRNLVHSHEKFRLYSLPRNASFTLHDCNQKITAQKLASQERTFAPSEAIAHDYA